MESTDQQGSRRAAKKPLQCASQPPAKVARLGQAVTRKVQYMTEELCGKEVNSVNANLKFSATSITLHWI